MPRSASRAAPGGLLLSLFPLLLAALFASRAPDSPFVVAARYPDYAVPAHTGGFGEPTCQACHFDGDLNAPGGRLLIDGWPEKPVPGEAYELTVRLSRAEMARAGFQLAIRTAAGAQAGTLEPTDARSTVTEGPGGVRYVHHTPEGTSLTADEAAAWRLVWTAPEAAGRLVAHVVANAANGDASEFGDRIYADSLQAEVGR